MRTKKATKRLRTRTVGVTLSEEEYAEWSRLAEATGRTLSGTVRFIYATAKAAGVGPFGEQR